MGNRLVIIYNLRVFLPHLRLRAYGVWVCRWDRVLGFKVFLSLNPEAETPENFFRVFLGSVPRFRLRVEALSIFVDPKPPRLRA